MAIVPIRSVSLLKPKTQSANRKTNQPVRWVSTLGAVDACVSRTGYLHLMHPFTRHRGTVTNEVLHTLRLRGVGMGGHAGTGF